MLEWKALLPDYHTRGTLVSSLRSSGDGAKCIPMHGINTIGAWLDEMLRREDRIWNFAVDDVILERCGLADVKFRHDWDCKLDGAIKIEFRWHPKLVIDKSEGLPNVNALHRPEFNSNVRLKIEICNGIIYLINPQCTFEGRVKVPKRFHGNFIYLLTIQFTLAQKIVIVPVERIVCGGADDIVISEIHPIVVKILDAKQCYPVDVRRNICCLFPCIDAFGVAFVAFPIAIGSRFNNEENFTIAFVRII